MAESVKLQETNEGNVDLRLLFLRAMVGDELVSLASTIAFDLVCGGR